MKLAMLLVLGLFYGNAQADCLEHVEDTARSVYLSGQKDPSAVGVDVEAFLRKQVMTTSDYEVYVRDENGTVVANYWVRTHGSIYLCAVDDISADGQSLPPSIQPAHFDETPVTLNADGKKYTLRKGLIDAAILASFPVVYYTWPRDKTYHYVAGASIALVANRVCHGVIFKKAKKRELLSDLCGLGSAMVAGALKEYWDSLGHGDPELNDFLATTAGGAVVTLRFVLK